MVDYLYSLLLPMDDFWTLLASFFFGTFWSIIVQALDFPPLDKRWNHLFCAWFCGHFVVDTDIRLRLFFVAVTGFLVIGVTLEVQSVFVIRDGACCWWPLTRYMHLLPKFLWRGCFRLVALDKQTHVPPVPFLGWIGLPLAFSKREDVQRRENIDHMLGSLVIKLPNPIASVCSKQFAHYVLIGADVIAILTEHCRTFKGS